MLTDEALPVAMARRSAAAEDVAAMLPALDPGSVALRNRFAVPREPFRPRSGGDIAEIGIAFADVPVEGELAFAFTLGTAHGRLRFSADLVARLEERLDLGGDFAAEGREAQALLVEYALLDVVRWIEAASGGELRVLAEDGGSDRHSLPFAASVRFADGGECRCGLELSRRTAERLADARQRLALAEPAAFEALPVRLTAVAGRQSLALAEIRDLQPGDVVMLADGHPGVAVHPRLSAPAERVASGIRLTGPLAVPPEFPEQEDHSMSDADDGIEGLEAVPVKLVFEFGRAELPLAEVRKLGPGSILPLERSVEEAVDIVANGRRIGRGSLVRIGEGLGVRVVDIASRG